MSSSQNTQRITLRNRIQKNLRSLPIIAPSILSADFSRLGDEVHAIEQANADWVHLDVMDGRFVPNITFGPQVVRALRTITSLPLDVHLMIVEPERYIDAFAEAGADIITIHSEATPHLHRALQMIRSKGCLAGVSLNPHTSEDAIRYVLSECDLVLIMSVNPGFGGQKFLPIVLPKLNALKGMIEAAELDVILEIDGGISNVTAREAALAGAQAFVAGNAIFSSQNYTDAIAEIRSAATLTT